MGSLSCCYCMTAKNGARVVAVLQLLASGHRLVSPEIAQEMLEGLKSTKNPNKRPKLLQPSSVEYPALKTPDENFSFVQMLQLYIFISSMISLITTVLLLYGLQKEKPKLILAYLIVHVIFYFVGIFMTSFIFIYTGAAVSQFLVIFLFVYLFGLYCLIVVYSAYYNIQKAVLEEQNPVVVAYYNA